MLAQFIGDNGLAEFFLDGLKKDIVIDVDAMKHIL